jgi:hypothetical protein
MFANLFRARRPQRPAPAPCFRPSLEGLEDRVVPSGGMSQASMQQAAESLILIGAVAVSQGASPQAVSKMVLADLFFLSLAGQGSPSTPASQPASTPAMMPMMSMTSTTPMSMM